MRRNNIRKTEALIMAFALSASLLLTGCGNSTGSKNTASNNASIVSSSNSVDNNNGSSGNQNTNGDSVNENNSIMRIFRDFQLRRIPSNEAFALIKAEINDSKEYNDAEVNVKIGNRRRKIKWNEFESMMGTYDISEKLYNAYSKSKDFVRELYISVDEYYNMITDSEVI